MHQLFEDHNNASTTNICLYSGHGHLPADARRSHRMGFVEWGTPFAQIPATLLKDPDWQRPIVYVPRQQQQPAPEPLNLNICPHLKRSYISLSVANRFHLVLNGTIDQVITDPGALPPALPTIHIMDSSDAYLVIIYSTSTHSPLPPHRFRFHIVAGVPDNFATIGQNVLEHMLVLHRARYNHAALAGAPTRRRLYFGRDSDSS